MERGGDEREGLCQSEGLLPLLLSWCPEGQRKPTETRNKVFRLIFSLLIVKNTFGAFKFSLSFNFIHRVVCFVSNSVCLHYCVFHNFQLIIMYYEC